MQKTLPVMFLTLGVLTGCGQVMVFGRVIGEPHAQDAGVSKASAPELSHVADPVPPSPPLPSSPIVHRVKSIALNLTPQATANAAADPRFNVAALAEAV